MASSDPRPESGTYRMLAPSPEILALQEAINRMHLARDADEVIQVLSETARQYSGAKAVSVFLYDPDSQALSGGDPRLLPETAVVDYVFEEPKPPTVPHGAGGFITVFPLRVQQKRVGVLVLDVTGMAEEAARMNPEPVSVLADQAAVILRNVQAVHRSMGESALLANILDSITNGIVTLDLESRITRMNRNAMAMLEVSGDVVGRSYPEVLLPEVVTAVQDLLHETHHHGYAMEKMVAARLPSGLELHLAVSTALLRDDKFLPFGTIIVLRDMTASHELDRLRKLDTMKSEFVANVSHELKTPLTSIKAYTEALLDMSSDEQTKSFLRVIDEESDRLLYLINDLLNVSRIQAGKMKMHFQPTAPRTLLDQVLNISKVQSERHRLEVQVEPGLPEMLLDREKMKESLINLISNAIKYSPKGGTVWVRLRREASNLRIEIEDQGIGIPEEHQKNLFQAFYRVDSSHTAEIPGTGLGLVIVKAIVEHHGGKIWLESQPGQGTTFFILIPIRQEIRRGEAGWDLGSMA
jgi:signal transduction histidine kinase